jgi:transcriptional regulator with XRE-family HTH domain
MDTKTEARDFLISRRARISPAEAGLVSYGARQVPGLRREEVATLAGVSVDYYNRMERGNLAGVSDGVLSAVAGALRLDEAERAHLFDLACAAGDRAAGRRRSPASPAVRPSVEWLVNAITGAAGFVVNSRQDILAANRLGRAFYAPVFESPGPANMARFTYLDPRARDFFTDWNRAAKECVAGLRIQAGRDPHDRGLSDLVGELSTRSQEFAALWATHDVRLHRKTEKHFRHPVAGELALRYERLAVDGDPGLEIFTYVAEPGSRAEEALSFLASYSLGGRDRAGHAPLTPGASPADGT